MIPVAAFIATALGCSGDGGLVGRTPVTVHVEGASAVSGLTLTVMHDSSVTAVLVDEIGLEDWSCTETLDVGQAGETCDIGTEGVAVTPPVDAWRVYFEHADGVVARDHVTSVACTGVDAGGAPVAVTCSLL